jgi:hypothetical protein
MQPRVEVRQPQSRSVIAIGRFRTPRLKFLNTPAITTAQNTARILAASSVTRSRPPHTWWHRIPEPAAIPRHPDKHARASPRAPSIGRGWRHTVNLPVWQGQGGFHPGTVFRKGGMADETWFMSQWLHARDP